MKYEDNKFIVYYNTCDEKYIDKLIGTIKDRMPSILSFFHIDYNDKIIVKLYDNLEEYKENIKESFAKQALEGEQPREYQNWMIANTEDGNINMQSLDLVLKQEEYRNYTEEEFLFNACHEFTHLCQQKVGSNSPGWFWEVIATTLGNPECQHETTELFTIQDLNERFDEIDGYGAVFKIGKYLFSNYDSDFVLSLAFDNKKMYETVNEVIQSLNSTDSKINKNQSR